MVEIKADLLNRWYQANKESQLSGRYIRPTDIQALLNGLKTPFSNVVIGHSFQDRPIHKIAMGSGPVRILIWSQMHGNESTGTKAVFDLIKFLQQPEELATLRDQLLTQCDICIIPMLNPDGAEKYTRINAMEIDLNRDVHDQKAPETRLLLSQIKEFNPHYCFNLHDQRTIFTVGDTKESATLSFLAPSEDEQRSITAGRKATMKVIVAMNQLLQKVLPGQIGRYTDEFYPTATGDNFQKMGHNTVLIESGHFKDDYQREKVRYFTFMALLQGLTYIASEDRELSYAPYFEIPNNGEAYLDELHRSIYLHSEKELTNVGVVYKEVLRDSTIHFEPEIKNYGELNSYSANTIVDHAGLKMKDLKELQRFLKKIS